MQLIRSPTAYDDVISNNPTTVKLRKRETPVRALEGKMLR